MYAVGITSSFEEIHRYDIVINCVGYDDEGRELFVDGCEGSELICEKESSSATIIIYVVPNKLPQDRVVTNNPPFPIDVVVTRFGEIIHNETYEVNQWGGATITIKL